MTNFDYELALKLQKQFENGYDPEEEKSRQLALQIQQDFDNEYLTEKSAEKLYYEDKQNQNKDKSKSLVDPSWEVIDPTPDICVLFTSFDKRFFWNTLQSVCVNWSKRMTSCAGVCSYSGHGGMCMITLSEPLLKLRPRKDLVQTLLHEMIHAFLFVTHNNKDRDGHGPEFHKHMHRINQEAGTNITVYHDFHDEVKLYQQHWWKCNGRCQYVKPFFGVIRRATNRAPGPNDFWWAQHNQLCGGTFIKIKEPEKPTKGKEKRAAAVDTKSGDIRNFLPKLNEVGVNKENKPNDQRVNDKPNDQRINDKPNDPYNQKNAYEISNTSFNATYTITNYTPFESTITNYSVVRNHWANKFDSSPNKRKIVFDDDANAKKSKAASDQLFSVNCPSCGIKCLENEINMHLDSCLNQKNDCDNCICDICKKTVNKFDIIGHMSQCLNDSVDFDML